VAGGDEHPLIEKHVIPLRFGMGCDFMDDGHKDFSADDIAHPCQKYGDEDKDEVSCNVHRRTCKTCERDELLDEYLDGFHNQEVFDDYFLLR
jgi:hypothetical protein